MAAAAWHPHFWNPFPWSWVFVAQRHTSRWYQRASYPFTIAIHPLTASIQSYVADHQVCGAQLQEQRRLYSTGLQDFFDSHILKGPEGAAQDTWSDPKQPQQDVVKVFRKAIREGNVALVTSSYFAIRQGTLDKCASALQPSLQTLEAADLVGAMRVGLGEKRGTLVNEAKTRNVPDERLAFVQQVMEDFQSIFQIDVPPIACHLSLLASSLRTDAQPRALLRCLLALQAQYEQYRTEAQDWTIVLTGFAGAGDMWGMWLAWRVMLRIPDMRVSTKLRDTVLATLLQCGHVTRAQRLASSPAHRGGLWPLEQQQVRSLATFVECACRAGHASDHQVASIVEHLRGRSKRHVEVWHALFVHAAMTGGDKELLRSVEEALNTDTVHFAPESFDIVFFGQRQRLAQLVSSGTEEEAQDYLYDTSRLLRVKPTRNAFAAAIHAILGIAPSLLEYPYARHPVPPRSGVQIPGPIPTYTPGQVHSATKLYWHFRKRGGVPDDALVHPLIVAHTSSFIPKLSDALAIYRDLCTSCEDHGTSRQDRVASITMSTYELLIAACARANDVIAMQSIVQDMSRDGTKLDHELRLKILMTCLHARQPLPAWFTVYESVRDTCSHGSPFSRQGWLTILDQFAKLSDVGIVVPPTMILHIIQDMQQFGMAPDVKVYTVLLDYIGRAYTRSRQQAHTQDELLVYRQAVLGLHRLLQHDARIQPDLHLITALMNAYNRVHLPMFVLELWKRLVIADTHVDPSCLAVFLDTCGRHGLMTDARRAWAWSRRHDAAHTPWPVNKDVWDAWIECLARCGALREAIDQTFTSMAADLSQHEHLLHVGTSGQSPDTQLGPDAKTIGMLLKFAIPDGPSLEADRRTFLSLRHRIQTQMPAIWPRVQHIGATQAVE